MAGRPFILLILLIVPLMGTLWHLLLVKVILQYYTHRLLVVVLFAQQVEPSSIPIKGRRRRTRATRASRVRQSLEPLRV